MTDMAVAPSVASPVPPASGGGGRAAAGFLTEMVEKGTLSPTRALLLSADLVDEALTLARLGFRVTVLDPRREALDALGGRARDDRVRLDLARGDYFRSPPSLFGPVELIVDRTFYAVLPPAERADWAYHAGRLLPMGGRLAGLFLVGRGHDGPPYPVSLDEFKRSLGRLFTPEVLEPAEDGTPGRPQLYRALYRRR